MTTPTPPPPVPLEAGVKPGKTTTEFYVTILSLLIGGVLLIKGDPTMREFAERLILFAAGGYTLSRGIAKAGAKGGGAA